MNVREFILRAQRTLNLTDSELARLCGVGRTAVVNWKSGRHEPAGSSVLAVVNKLLERFYA